MLTQIEKDFVEFLSSRGEKKVLEKYLKTKATLDFGSDRFREFCSINYQALQVFFNDESESSAIVAYKYFACQDLLRMLSYSFQRPPNLISYLRTGIQKLKSGRLQRARVEKEQALNRMLASKESHVIVDYGCGLGYLSFDLAKRAPGSRVVLVDIDTIKFEFAIFRFQKHGIPVTPIFVTEAAPYPVLPSHTICIAQEVIEHLHDPLAAYGNIRNGLQKGGYLYGDFDDHGSGHFHVSPNLARFRAALKEDFHFAGGYLYRKK